MGIYGTCIWCIVIIDLGVNVFGFWKHNFWWNILYTESKLWTKVPEFSAESLCLRQGMATSGRWCHMTLLDPVTPVGGWQLGCPDRCPCSVQASRIHQGRPLVAIPWRRQRDSAKNSGTFPPIWLCRMCDHKTQNEYIHRIKDIMTNNKETGIHFLKWQFGNN